MKTNVRSFIRCIAAVLGLSLASTCAHAAVTSTTTSACNTFTLRTSKSYVAIPSSYTFLFGILRCGADGKYTATEVGGQLEVEYKVLVNAPDQAGYLPPEAIRWQKTGTFKVTPTTTRSWEVPVRQADLDALYKPLAGGAAVRNTVAIFRARPLSNPEIGWSQWVQVNYNTPYSLWDTNPLWDFDQRKDVRFVGRNYLFGENFQSLIAQRDKTFAKPNFVSTDSITYKNQVNSVINSAAGVHIYTKNNRFGYHDTPMGSSWQDRQHGNNFWHLSLSTKDNIGGVL